MSWLKNKKLCLMKSDLQLTIFTFLIFLHDVKLTPFSDLFWSDSTQMEWLDESFLLFLSFCWHHLSWTCHKLSFNHSRSENSPIDGFTCDGWSLQMPNPPFFSFSSEELLSPPTLHLSVAQAAPHSSSRFTTLSWCCDPLGQPFHLDWCAYTLSLVCHCDHLYL